MYSDIAANKRKSGLILSLFVVFIGLLGWLLTALLHGGYALTAGVLIGGIIYAAITYFAGSSLALAVNGARELRREDNLRLWRIIENLAIADGLPMPRVYLINDPAPNAFATGRRPEKAAVCATTGLLDIMSDTELEGVFAHELGHIKNYDIRVSMVAFGLTAAVSLLADTILRLSFFRDDRENNNPALLVLAVVAAIAAPFMATLIQLAISRQREYLADATGALTTRYPEGLASALQKLIDHGQPMRRQNTATAHLFFASPLKKGSLANLFSTHPPLPDRIARLQAMEGHA